MNILKKITKIIFFGLALLILSAGYRLFGEKSTNKKEGDNFLANEAKADVPGDGGGGGGGGGDGGVGCGCGDS